MVDVAELRSVANKLFKGFCSFNGVVEEQIDHDQRQVGDDANHQ